MQKQTMQYISEDSVSMISPRFLVRVSGLPIDPIKALRFEQITQWHNGLLSLEDMLIRRKDRLVDILHEAVSVHKENQAVRRKLLNFKRDVFNMRVARMEEARSLVEFLVEGERALLSEWLDLWESYQQQMALGTGILEREFVQKRKELKKIITTPDFRKGVLLSSPILNQAVDSYLASDNLRLNREARTVERSLLEYLFRAACKTSPFSTFTPVCIGMLEEGEGVSERDIDLEITGVEKQSFTRLNMTILSRLSPQIIACLEIRKALLVRVTNGWQLQNKHIKYVRRKPMIDMFGTDVPLPLDFVQEHVIQLPISSLLGSLLELIGDGHEERIGDLIVRLCSQGAYKGAEAKVEEYFQHLLRLGFLIVPALQVDIHNIRPLDAYCQGLRTIVTPQTAALADHLETITSLVDVYANSSLLVRAELLEQIRHLLDQCGTLLGVTQEAILLPKTSLYEDTTLAARRLVIHQHQKN